MPRIPSRSASPPPLAATALAVLAGVRQALRHAADAGARPTSSLACTVTSEPSTSAVSAPSTPRDGLLAAEVRALRDVQRS